MQSVRQPHNCRFARLFTAFGQSVYFLNGVTLRVCEFDEDTITHELRMIGLPDTGWKPALGWTKLSTDGLRLFAREASRWNVVDRTTN
jgi:hypothetical protein